MTNAGGGGVWPRMELTEPLLGVGGTALILETFLGLPGVGRSLFFLQTFIAELPSGAPYLY